ncbi:DUF6688 family protein [Pedobacter gandavensis]|uniref:DUF6688 domain-containing protein n=1 Tax=Pedobacter gandavensis TaxID=2679963 RepID=UPI00292EFDBD|nr:DUF6688 family protein [Pedobacter gandavensis]
MKIKHLFIAAFGLSFLMFILGFLLYSADHYTAIDIVEGGYSPFASEHLLTLLTFFVLALFGLIRLWKKGRAQPPLMYVLSLVFVFIGIPISFVVWLQITSNTEHYDAWLLGFLPIVYIVTAVALFAKSVSEEAVLASDKDYHNKFLNYLNQKMANTAHQPYYVIILLVPVFVIVVAILTLFGQDANSISKVFTETTTWNFSTKTHPPFLDHTGHYLCTVAVCGDPKVVKPLRLGRRHGREIVVNRQLLIANAFEELIAESWPAAHRIIRGFYDKYGYPLSKKITSPQGSNLVYRLMKPLEYFFLLCLYLGSEKPEEKIAKQYSS